MFAKRLFHKALVHHQVPPSLPTPILLPPSLHSIFRFHPTTCRVLSAKTTLAAQVCGSGTGIRPASMLVMASPHLAASASDSVALLLLLDCCREGEDQPQHRHHLGMPSKWTRRSRLTAGCPTQHHCSPSIPSSASSLSQLCELPSKLRLHITINPFN